MHQTYNNFMNFLYETVERRWGEQTNNEFPSLSFGRILTNFSLIILIRSAVTVNKFRENGSTNGGVI